LRRWLGLTGGTAESVLAVDLLLRRRLVRPFVSASASTSASAFGDGRSAGNGGMPPLVINATPRRWRGSAESNFEGRKTIGCVEPGRWKALTVSCYRIRRVGLATHDSFGMQPLNHRNVLGHVFVVAQDHSHRNRQQSFASQSRDRDHSGSGALGHYWPRWV
jgi:hypothetical protein